MKSYTLLFILTLSAIYCKAQNAESVLIIGKWYNYDKTEIIEITQLNNNFAGHIFWMKNSNDKNGNLKLDKKNPDIKLRYQPILGSQNLFELQYENGNWVNGEMYSHKRGGAAKFKVISISETHLVIKISIGFFSKELTYTKAE